MKGGRVTNRSAGPTDLSVSSRCQAALELTRDTTSPEPASKRVTLIPVCWVKASNCVRYQALSPLGL